MFAKISHVEITAIRAAVPAREVSLEDELEYYDGSLKKAQRARNMIGTDKRRLAWPGQTASDLCFCAAEALLSDYPDLKNSLDAIFFVTQSPDYLLPASACILHHRLGLPVECAAFDVNQGCAGYIYGLWLAASLLNSGCRNALLLAGDVPLWPHNRKNRVIAPIFGDGGSATLLRFSQEAPDLLFSIGADGAGYKFLTLPAGATRLPFSLDPEKNRVLLEDIPDQNSQPWRLYDTWMNGKAIFEFTLRVVPEHIRQFLKKCKTLPENVNYFILHQANKQIITEIARKGGFPLEKTPRESFSKYGNLSSASIPAALCDLFGQTEKINGKKLLLCGFGVGFAWGSTLWQAGNCDIRPVINVPEPVNTPSWEDKVRKWQTRIQGEVNENG